MVSFVSGKLLVNGLNYIYSECLKAKGDPSYFDEFGSIISHQSWN